LVVSLFCQHNSFVDLISPQHTLEFSLLMLSWVSSDLILNVSSSSLKYN